MILSIALLAGLAIVLVREKTGKKSFLDRVGTAILSIFGTGLSCGLLLTGMLLASTETQGESPVSQSSAIAEFDLVALKGKKSKFAWEDDGSINFYYRKPDSSVARSSIKFPDSIKWGGGPTCVITSYSLKSWVAFPFSSIQASRVKLVLPNSSAVYDPRSPQPAV